MNRTYRKARKSSGISIPEISGAAAIFIPLVVLVIFVIVECNDCYVIHNGLTQAAQTAVHDLGVVWSSQTLTNTATLTRAQQDAVYNTIVINGIIPANNSGGQNPNFSNATFNLTSNPPTVSVTVSFVPGMMVMPYPFARLRNGFVSFLLPSGSMIQSTATYALPSKTNNSATGG